MGTWVGSVGRLVRLQVLRLCVHITVVFYELIYDGDYSFFRLSRKKSKHYCFGFFRQPGKIMVCTRRQNLYGPGGLGREAWAGGPGMGGLGRGAWAGGPGPGGLGRGA